MTEYQTVCRIHELIEGEGKTVIVNGKLVALFRDQGRFFAIDDCCPHMGASLSGGFVQNGTVTCPWHAWRFRLTDGAWADCPRVAIGCHAVRVTGEEIQIQLQEKPAKPPQPRPPPAAP